MQLPFRDRAEAGQVLGRQLEERYGGRDDVIVLGLPRGGIPVAYEVAHRLDAPLDVFLVRKLGVPGHEELAMGAIASGGVRVMNPEVLRSLRLGEDAIERVAQAESRELDRRDREYRGERPRPDLSGKTVIVVDDGLATGSTMRAAVEAIGAQGPAATVVAVPVAAPSVCEQFRREVDDVVCAATPQSFQAVGLWYEDFGQTSDAEVKHLLQTANRWADANAG